MQAQVKILVTEDTQSFYNTLFHEDNMARFPEEIPIGRDIVYATSGIDSNMYIPVGEYKYDRLDNYIYFSAPVRISPIQ